MIHEIRIQNFKSIQDVTVEFSDVTVLVGRSGTGKSNFVEAVRFLRDLLRGQPGGSGGGMGGVFGGGQNPFALMRPLPMTEAPTRFEICFSVRSSKERYRYLLDLGKSPEQGRFGEEKLLLGDTILYHQSSDKNAMAWIQEPRLVDIPKPGGIALGRMPSLSDVVVAYAALTEGIGCYTFPNSVMLIGARRKRGNRGFRIQVPITWIR